MLKVTVTGLPGEGKTTVALEIRELLSHQGFQVAFQDQDGALTPQYLAQHPPRLAAVTAGRPAVELVTASQPFVADVDRWRAVADEPLPEVGTHVRIWRKTPWGGEKEASGIMHDDGLRTGSLRTGQSEPGVDFLYWRPRATGPTTAITTKD